MAASIPTGVTSRPRCVCKKLISLERKSLKKVVVFSHRQPTQDALVNLETLRSKARTPQRTQTIFGDVDEHPRLRGTFGEHSEKHIVAFTRSWRDRTYGRAERSTDSVTPGNQLCVWESRISMLPRAPRIVRRVPWPPHKANSLASYGRHFDCEADFRCATTCGTVP